MHPEDNTSTADDAELVERCRRGEEQAWALLVRRYQRLVYTIVLRVGLDQHAAADVFQTVFSRLLDHLPRIAQPDRLRAWIVTCAKREALLQRARARRTVSLSPVEDAQGPSSTLELADEAPLPEEVLSGLQQAHVVREALERMDERCRSLLVLMFQDEEPAYQEIARRMDMPVGSIGPTRARCLDKLRRMLV